MDSHIEISFIIHETSTNLFLELYFFFSRKLGQITKTEFRMLELSNSMDNDELVASTWSQNYGSLSTCE